MRRLSQGPRAYDQNRGRKKVVNAHAGSRTRVTSMGGLYDAATLRALVLLLGVGCQTSPHDEPAQGKEPPASKLFFEGLPPCSIWGAAPPRVSQPGWRYDQRGHSCSKSAGHGRPNKANNAKQSAASRACRRGRRMACHTMQMTPAGLEPAIPASVGRCLIHWATGPCALCDPAWALLWRDKCCEHIPRNRCWSYFYTRLGQRLAEPIAPLSRPSSYTTWGAPTLMRPRCMGSAAASPSSAADQFRWRTDVVESAPLVSTPPTNSERSPRTVLDALMSWTPTRLRRVCGRFPMGCA